MIEKKDRGPTLWQKLVIFTVPMLVIIVPIGLILIVIAWLIWG